MRYNKNLLKYTIVGAILVSIFGTLLHFAYEWSKENVVVGLFTPVNESTWEHMKLLFFPMLLYVVLQYDRLKPEFPGILWGSLTGILAGTFAIPLLFYGYTGILGKNFMVLDIATFFVSVIIGFLVSYFLAGKEFSRRYKIVVTVLVIVMAIAFMVFTYNPPDAGIFTDPLKTDQTVRVSFEIVY